MNTSNKDELLLTQLIFMFQTAALQQMGKLKNPISDKIEKDLSQAQISIDLLEMLHRKMNGNLSTEEERVLSSVLQELKLNYVDEASKESSNQPSAPETQTPS